MPKTVKLKKMQRVGATVAWILVRGKGKLAETGLWAGSTCLFLTKEAADEQVMTGERSVRVLLVEMPEEGE